MKMFLPEVSLPEDKQEGLHVCNSETEKNESPPPSHLSSIAVGIWLALLRCLGLPTHPCRSLTSTTEHTLLAVTEKAATGHQRKPYSQPRGMQTHSFSSATAAGQTPWNPSRRLSESGGRAAGTALQSVQGSTLSVPRT